MSDYSINSLSTRFADLKATETFDGYSGVEIVVDENTTYFAGSTAGRVLPITNPWGTQQQADNILTKIQGYQYQPYTATDAILDPSAELGDGVNLNGLYGGIYRVSRKFTDLMAADISAPADEEIDHEYPFEKKENREINRRFTAVESEFSLQSDLISAKVSQTGGDNSSFGWQLLSDHFSLYSGSNEVFRVDSSGATVKGHFEATSGKIGNFNIGKNAIWNNISDFANSGNLSSGVYLGTNGIRLGKNFTVNSSGNVTANNMELNGTLKIGGSNITAAALRSGAQSAYTNGSRWSTGSGYGYNYNDATQNGATSYPRYFKCANLTVTSVSALDTVYASTLYVNGSKYTPRFVTIDGKSFYVLST